MGLSWNDIRANAARFARDWKGHGYEKGDAQSFYNEFFEVFGASRRRVASFEQPVKGLPDNKRGFIDLFWKGVLLVEQKSMGHDLEKAHQQALDYFPGLKDADLPRFVLACDFQRFELYDLDENRSIKFPLADLPKHVRAFSFIIGDKPAAFKDQDPANIKASELMGQLHDALLQSGFVGHDLERLLVRLLFCMFADSTGIFQTKWLFRDYVRDHTDEDGSDLGGKLQHLFEVLNTDKSRRQTNLDPDLAQFEYINGDLFAERLAVASFDKNMRDKLLKAANFTWEKVSPAIFGALFQSVMDKKKRRAIGAHYTTEQNILKVLGPMFLDDLNAELAKIMADKSSRRTAMLRAFQDKLASIKCFDPACGCGNFLVIAYRELRRLETEVIKELSDQRELDVAILSKVNVDQFYGIELEEFPARIAEVAMWMTDHIMNVLLSDDLGQYFARIPLRARPTIRQGDALETDWSSVLPPEECTYIIGNPPFVGSKQGEDEQRAQIHRLAAMKGRKGTLDFVAGWFLKAGAYVQTSRATIGFVTTNSITQGEQVAQLWPILFQRYKLEIFFAHRTFAWGSEARGKANVHCVILGLCRAQQAPSTRRLFDYPDIKGDPIEVSVKSISPYLFDAGGLSDPHTVVARLSRSPADRPPMMIGSKPIDGGFYIFTPEERAAFEEIEPESVDLFVPFIGSHEFINGESRWLLRVDRLSPTDLAALPHVRHIISQVRDFRLGLIKGKNKRKIKEGSADGAKLAEYPTRFHVTIRPTEPFLVVPETSSERREYIPIGWAEPPTIPSSLVRIVPHATPLLFGIITSRMHNAWLKIIGGRMKSDPRYSIDIVYNPFPMPVLDDTKTAQIAELAEKVLEERAKWMPASSLAHLYDPLGMPPDLKAAHRKLDAAVDKSYRKEPFASDRNRAEHLMGIYERERAALLELAAKPSRKRKAAVVEVEV
ncbi:class I SAM-dependent DNA methyltransferase [Devosia salina]|uniref:site-specific DNA-methyltransferase (adenine-specific) n=1 Tax=Devosia salina TaxID=2860336 RepID=A0ABX8W9Z2_9HYPH|nr:DNA methyltransferase [Devosia salina]QYO75613.1 N-6 DNA methylase [Devosia salina]